MNQIRYLFWILSLVISSLSQPLMANTDVSESEAIETVWHYLDAVALHPSVENLGTLLSEDVIKKHISNGKVTVPNAKGKDAVLDLYIQNIFNISSNFVVKRFDVNTNRGANQPSMFAVIEEDKMLPDGTVSRFRIVTQTYFTLERETDGIVRITEMAADNTVVIIPRQSQF